MRRTSISLFLLVSGSLLLPASAIAMRCGTVLISKGDIQAKVLKYCGEPTQTTGHYALKNGYVSTRNTGISVGSQLQSGTRYYYPFAQIEVLVENWIFNLGPSRLIRQITFENGIVTDVDTLGYGYHD